jgi:hypothetical protein
LDSKSRPRSGFIVATVTFLGAVHISFHEVRFSVITLIELDHLITWITTFLAIHEGRTEAEVGAVHALEFSAEGRPIVRRAIRALTRLQDERRFVGEIQGLPTRVGIGS